MLVGHSYDGAAITDAATGNANVESLFHINAYVPAQGETPTTAGTLGDGIALGSARLCTTVPGWGGRAMAQRAHSHITQIHCSHVTKISHPDIDTNLILAAAHAHR